MLGTHRRVPDRSNPPEGHVIRIRPVDVEDVAWMAPRATAWFAEFADDYGDAVSRWAADPTVDGWVCEAGGQPAGFTLIGSIGLVGEQRPRVLEVFVLAVDPDHRRRGAARSLLARAMQQARSEAGVREIRVRVATENVAAIALFIQAGFVVDRDEDGHLDHGQRVARLRWTPRHRATSPG